MAGSNVSWFRLMRGEIKRTHILVAVTGALLDS